MSNKGKYWFWRDTGLKPQFFGVHAAAAAPFLFFIVHMRLWTLTLSMVTVLALWVLAQFGYTVPVFVNMLSRALAGTVVKARPWWYWERFSRK